jgi:hypothetical protein
MMPPMMALNLRRQDHASVLKTKKMTRHKSVHVLAAYVRRVDMFKDHAGAAFL